MDAARFENDGTIPPRINHRLLRPLLTMVRSEAAPPSILPKSKRARLLTPAFNKVAASLEAVLLVLVNLKGEVQTLSCMRRVNSDEIQGEEAVQMEALIQAGYVPIGLLVLPTSDRIDDYIDASGVLRWPAETWENCRSIEESRRFIGHVAEELAPASYHLRHVPDGIAR